MSLRYSFFAIVPDGIIEIPQGTNLSWLTLFYALPKELVEKYPTALSLPRNIYELLDDPDSVEIISNDMFLQLVWDCYSYMTRRIGATTYKVKVVFNESGTKTMEDKILRIVRNEVHTKEKSKETQRQP